MSTVRSGTTNLRCIGCFVLFRVLGKWLKSCVMSARPVECLSHLLAEINGAILLYCPGPNIPCIGITKQLRDCKIKQLHSHSSFSLLSNPPTQARKLSRQVIRATGLTGLHSSRPCYSHPHNLSPPVSAYSRFPILATQDSPELAYQSLFPSNTPATAW